MDSKGLSVWQAACIITGYGVGSGIMALPYLVALVLVTNLSAYVAGGADVIASWGVPPVVAKLAFYILAAAVVFFGLKILGVSESVSVVIIIAIMLVLAAGSIMNWNNPLPLELGKPNELLAFFAMAMMAFVAFFSVPQAVEGLDGDPRKVRRVIILGLGMNLAFIFVVVLCSLASSSPETGITDVAIVGWSAGIGAWAQVLGSVFTVLAMLTTFWSISLALADIIREQLSWHHNICWLVATIPSLVIVLLNLGGFIEIMRTAGGLIAILIAFLVPLAFRKCRKANGRILLPEDVRMVAQLLGAPPKKL